MSDEQKRKKQFHLFPLSFDKIRKLPDWYKTLVSIMALIALLLVLAATLIGITHLTFEVYNNYLYPKNEQAFANIRNSLLILAGLIGIPFFLWRTGIAQSQATTARDRAYTELFTKAIEQLGAEKPAKKVIMGEDQTPTTVDDYVPNIEVRIGAIYALERIMNDSEKDAPAIVDTLAAYVRENCGKATLQCNIPEKENFETTGKWVSAISDYISDPWRPAEGSLVARTKALAEQPQVNRADIKTALTVLGRRPDWLKNPENFKTESTEKPDLRNVNFQGWDLSKFDLSYCNLSDAQMQGANLLYAAMQGANLLYAKMQGADLLYVKMQGADLSGAEMQGANLSYAEMQGANLLYAKMQGANLSYAEMQGANLLYAKMQGADLLDAKMQGADMANAQMQGTDLSGAKMQGAVLSGAEMQVAVLSYAEIDEVQITSARKKAASVISVDFTKSKFEFEELQAQLHDMFGHQTLTTLPAKMNPPDFWSKADMDTREGQRQYQQEWEVFKKEKGVE